MNARTQAYVQLIPLAPILLEAFSVRAILGLETSVMKQHAHNVIARPMIHFAQNNENVLALQVNPVFKQA